MLLQGKAAIVTGAASGIGAASATLFGEQGAQVLAVDRPGSGLAEKHAGNKSIHTLELDITGNEAPSALIKAAQSQLGGIDVLFNNAGVSSNALAEHMSDAEWDRTFDVNLRAMFRICREAIPVLRHAAEKKGRARIINTASVMAFDTDFGLSAYTASKHGVAGLTKTLALELGKYHITANYVLPGAIYTGMTRISFDNDDIRKVWEKKAALRRIGQPIDIARAALLLASDHSDFITGHGLVADGGLTLRT